MERLEDLIWKAHASQESKLESKKSLERRLKFEEYQQDFEFNKISLQEESFLDVGTGTGAFVAYLQEEKHNPHAFGIDITCESTSLPFCVEGSIEQIPYSNNSFQNTVSRNVLHALMLQEEGSAKVKNALSELVRVTRHGGTIFYSGNASATILEKIRISSDLHEAQRELTTRRFKQGLQEEDNYLFYLESLGHTIKVTHKNNRRVVNITLRAVQ